MIIVEGVISWRSHTNQFDDAEEVQMVVIPADCVVSAEFITASTLYN